MSRSTAMDYRGYQIEPPNPRFRVGMWIGISQIAGFPFRLCADSESELREQINKIHTKLGPVSLGGNDD